VPAGAALRTEPAAGSELEAGSAVSLLVSIGPEPVVVPDLVGFDEAEALVVLGDAGLSGGSRETIRGDDPAGTIVAQDPAPGSEVPSGTAVSYMVSQGPARQGPPPDPAIPSEVVVQLDAISAAVGDLRGLAPAPVPYSSASESAQAAAVNRWQLIHDPAQIAGEEAALKRLGLLPADASLPSLLDRLYGQPQPVVYVEGQALAVLEGTESLSPPQRGYAAREVGRGALDQAFALSSIRVNNRTQGDRALARLSLELGDATAAMLEWASANLGANAFERVLDIAIPGRDGLREGMPPVVRAEYELPYTAGRAFVETIRARGGWSAVDELWASPPQSTEQILHPERYPNDRPVGIDLAALAGSLGRGWSESWAQTMGELRMAVWLSDGPAALGWGGDRLVSLEGPDGAWAIVWQTAWDGGSDADEFASAAQSALAGLPGAHGVFRGADVVGGLPSPVLLIVTSDESALQSVSESLGVGGG
jgi:hypothetical protein